MFRYAILVFLLPLLCSCSSLGHYVIPPSGDVNSVKTTQVIVVRPVKGFDAVLVAWEKAGQGWQRILGPWPAVIGRNGLAPAGGKHEGDGRTPSGTYPITRAFGRAPVFKTGLAYQQATANDVWVDDASSPQYNQWVHGKPQASSFENMLRPDGLYDWGAVIEYNTNPIVAGAGSAIFMHIWRDNGRKPTAGCVALDKSRLKRLLSWLDAHHSPVIILEK